MNDIVAQAQRQLALSAQESATALAEAQARMDRAHAAAARNSEEVAQASARAAAALPKNQKKNGDGFLVETFAFGPDPDSPEESGPETARAPQQAPVPSPTVRRRPAQDEDRTDEDGPRIFNEDSW